MLVRAFLGMWTCESLRGVVDTIGVALACPQGRDGCWKAFANGAGCESETDGDDSEDVAFIAGLIDHVRAVHMFNRGPEYDERVIVTG